MEKNKNSFVTCYKDFVLFSKYTRYIESFYKVNESEIVKTTSLNKMQRLKMLK